MTTLPRERSPHIVGPVYDALFFLAPPLVAFALGILLAESGASERYVEFGGESRRLVGVCLGILIHAHLVAVFARSHLDAAILQRHRVRFVVVPLLLFGALLASPHLAAASIVVATFWDVYHSGAQTFGLARIYDRNAGRKEDTFGRRLDAIAQQLLYAGPIAAGVSLAAHVHAFDEFESFDDPISAVLASIPAAVESRAGLISKGVLGFAAAFFVFYLAHRTRCRARGDRSSPRAALLVTVTGLCSVVTWGFDRWGEAFLVMNTFHAVQYLALVNATEGAKVGARLGLPSSGAGRLASVLLFLGATFGYGFLVEWSDAEVVWATSMVVSLMHFWYDGFVWSVRRGDV